MAKIHPTAIVDRRVELADDVTVGAFSIIKEGVKIAAGTQVLESCHIEGNTVIGRNCRIGPAAFVGLPPQHLKHDGAGTGLIIGDQVVVRETASIHRSISPEPGHETRVGNRTYLMAGAHIGHDCIVGEDVMLAQHAMLGGHAIIGDRVFIGGSAAVHQFGRVGRIAILGGVEGLTHDIPPFGASRYGGLKGYNAIGCKRAGFPQETLHAIRHAYHIIHENRTWPGAIRQIEAEVEMLPEIQELIDFVRSSKRGVLHSVRGAGIARMGVGRADVME
jgi:UDP-N-acetylglucosamine acyltransferase